MHPKSHRFEKNLQAHRRWHRDKPIFNIGAEGANIAKESVPLGITLLQSRLVH